MREKGFGAMRLLLIIVLGSGGVAVLGKVVPPYLDYFAFKRAATAVSDDANADTMPVQAARDLLLKKLLINNVATVSSEDIEISRHDGKLEISADYSVETALAGPFGIIMHFSHSTAP